MEAAAAEATTALTPRGSPVPILGGNPRRVITVWVGAEMGFPSESGICGDLFNLLRCSVNKSF